MVGRKLNFDAPSKIGVLVVDPFRRDRENMMTTLRRGGYMAESVRTVEEAARCIERKRPKVVISELRLPEYHDGLALVRQFKKIREGQKAPPFQGKWVVQTNAASPEMIHSALVAGAWDYMVKPVDDTMTIAVLAMLGMRSPRSGKPNERHFLRGAIKDVSLTDDQNRQGEVVDISEGGLAWFTHEELLKDQVRLVHSEDLCELLDTPCAPIYIRVRYARRVPDGRYRVAGTFIGLTEHMRRQIRQHVLGQQLRGGTRYQRSAG